MTGAELWLLARRRMFTVGFVHLVVRVRARRRVIMRMLAVGMCRGAVVERARSVRSLKCYAIGMCMLGRKYKGEPPGGAAVLPVYLAAALAAAPGVRQRSKTVRRSVVEEGPKTLKLHWDVLDANLTGTIWDLCVCRARARAFLRVCVCVCLCVCVSPLTHARARRCVFFWGCAARTQTSPAP
jgi:hypothetical protein